MSGGPGRPRVVVAGLGDSGTLVAIHLARHVDVVGITTKPALVSGQELGMRLARPEEWVEDYRLGFERYRGLDRVRRVQGRITGVDLDARRVRVETLDGRATEEPYDVLVVSTGVGNGFWRRPDLQTDAQVDADLREAHEQLAAAGSVVVVGGGAAAVSTAANLALRWPGTRVDLHFPGERALPQHHPRTWSHVRRRLEALGVGLHPGHRAVVPDGFACDRLTTGPVAWSTGQDATEADVVVWAIGRVTPHTSWLPAEVLDPDGFVVVGPTLQVPGRPEVLAVGDVAASDPLRSSARNRADKLVARNVRALLADKPLGTYRAPRSRWGSVLGSQPDGLTVYTPTGQPVRIPAWANRRVLRPLVVRRGIYRGVRRA